MKLRIVGRRRRGQRVLDYFSDWRFEDAETGKRLEGVESFSIPEIRPNERVLAHLTIEVDSLELDGITARVQTRISDQLREHIDSRIAEVGEQTE